MSSILRRGRPAETIPSTACRLETVPARRSHRPAAASSRQAVPDAAAGVEQLTVEGSGLRGPDPGPSEASRLPGGSDLEPCGRTTPGRRARASGVAGLVDAPRQAGGDLLEVSSPAGWTSSVPSLFMTRTDRLRMPLDALRKCRVVDDPPVAGGEVHPRQHPLRHPAQQLFLRPLRRGHEVVQRRRLRARVQRLDARGRRLDALARQWRRQSRAAAPGPADRSACPRPSAGRDGCASNRPLALIACAVGSRSAHRIVDDTPRWEAALGVNAADGSAHDLVNSRQRNVRNLCPK